MAAVAVDGGAGAVVGAGGAVGAHAIIPGGGGAGGGALAVTASGGKTVRLFQRLNPSCMSKKSYSHYHRTTFTYTDSCRYTGYIQCDFSLLYS